jgi:hypothetical protein
MSGGLRLQVEQPITSRGASYAGETTAMQGVVSRQIDVQPDSLQCLASGMDTINASGPSAHIRGKSTPFRNGFSEYYPYGRLDGKAFRHKSLISLAAQGESNPCFRRERANYSVRGGSWAFSYVFVFTWKCNHSVHWHSALTAPVRAHRQDTNWTQMQRQIDAPERSQ